MKKFKLVKILALIAVLVLGSGLAACDNLPVVDANIACEGDNTYKSLGTVIMNAGEKLTIDQSRFNGLYSNVKPDWTVGEFDRFELFVHSESHEGVTEINCDTITAANSGYAVVTAKVYVNGKDPYGKKIILSCSVKIAEIYVINEATMTHIKTAQELSDMNKNLSGNYILKADIDLAGWGEWTPIGRSVFYTEPSQTFTGMFVNPYGYKIKNLTITTCKTGDGLYDFGLFGNASEPALISGIFLKDISIDVSDYDTVHPEFGYPALYSVGSPKAGGIAASSGARILDCVVTGTIIGGGTNTGGIVGSNGGDILGCSFTGTLKNYNRIVDWDCAIGGIAGYHAADVYKDRILLGLIKNCTVNAQIDGGKNASAGGIIGYMRIGTEAAVENCSFAGTVLSTRSAGTMIGFYEYGPGPINFD